MKAGDSKPKDEGLPPDKAYDLIKLQVLREVQDDLVDWAKRRLWLIGIVATVIGIPVGIVGFDVLVRNTVESLVQDRVSDVEKAAQNAVVTARVAEQSTHRWLADLNRETDKRLANLEVVEKRVNDTKREVDDVVTMYRASLTRLNAVENRIQQSKDLLRRLSLLSFSFGAKPEFTLEIGWEKSDIDNPTVEALTAVIERLPLHNPTNDAYFVLHLNTGPEHFVQGFKLGDDKYHLELRDVAMDSQYELEVTKDELLSILSRFVKADPSFLRDHDWALMDL